jgi:hypothetical protein
VSFNDGAVLEVVPSGFLLPRIIFRATKRPAPMAATVIPMRVTFFGNMVSFGRMIFFMAYPFVALFCF